ncbi:cellulose biosynthesis protein BcsC [Vreelandella gomseomensis]|uniref:Cellulose synthase subunit BcsC-related outer membrane protein n=1 Tax=Vreelandella gomseomensis TaxID=370766 RepID=A0ABU1GES7_9GAMM|nr:cellulose synthase subunit BcsC-related outer membrane protein [Halomonas gomseomensis]MDR5875986.1 cellulose synthase subunit BcsC-related outer membrane protein [Halomonas gomseomensis]
MQNFFNTLAPATYKKRVLIGALACSLPGGMALAQENTSSALSALLNQADYWQENQRPDLAREALERYLDGRPDHPEVLYRLARHALMNDDIAEAQEWINRLEQLDGNDPRLVDLRRLERGKNIDSNQLSRARQLAQNGQYKEAARIYSDLFNGDMPSRSLAVEYYQTLAGTSDAGWREARDGLQEFNDDYPDDQELALALSEVLTYREGTRRQGIKQLATLSRSNNDSVAEEARDAWRQALLWLSATPADEQLYAAYLDEFPEDTSVEERYETSTTETRRGTGYSAMASNDLSDAEEAFQDALEEDPDDAEAKAGLGILRLRQQRFNEARNLLEEAIDEAPEQRDEWMPAFQSASFYARLSEARRLADADNLERALSTVRPLTQQGGASGRSARLLEADILKRQRRLDAAEKAYRRILNDWDNNADARLGLAQVLAEKGNWREAQQVAQSLPSNMRDQLSGLASSQVNELRRRAESGDAFDAETALRQAIELSPRDPWARLDLARLLEAQGREEEAQATISALDRPDATPEQRYAYALYSSENDQWAETQRALSSISTDEMTNPMRELRQQAALQQPLQEALEQLARGNRRAAFGTLDRLYADNPDLSPRQVGQVASMLNEAGETQEAARWVDRDLAQGLNPEYASAYLNHALVLARHGRPGEANQLLERVRQQDNSLLPQDELERVENGIAVIDADRLRRNGQLASAYDAVATPLREQPDNEELLLAMGRIYADGERYSQAEQIYTYALTRHPDSGPALQGAVQTSLASGRPQKAQQLLDRYQQGSDTPEMLLLKARVARSNGDSSRALALLSKARQSLGGSGGRTLALSSSNPFTNSSQNDQSGSNDRPTWLPGGSDRPVASSSEREMARAPSVREQIDSLAREIRYERAPRLGGEFAFNFRDGESGLSEQNRVEAPVSFSATPFGEGRFDVTVTPTSVDAGTPTGNSVQRFGRSALAESAGTLDQSLNGLTPILDEIESSVTSFFDAQNRLETAQDNPDIPESEIDRLTAELEEAESNYNSALDRNPVYEAGLRIADLTQAQRDVFADYLGEQGVDFDALALDGTSAESFANSREVIESSLSDIQSRLQSAAQAARPGSQRESGAALAMGYEYGDVDVDIGSTPLGFDETNIVGGINWTPNITENTSLSFTAERRAVKDSLLSYAGAHDAQTGDSWGGVVRTGGRLGINYDTPSGGVYANAGAYEYTGNNVADNTAYDVSLGGYARPINSEKRELQTGINVSAMAYDQDLSHFTYGHGGYFSPQDYVSVSFPIRYQENVSDDLSWAAQVSPGYQSYSTDDIDYFPTDPSSQALLDVFSTLIAGSESRYSGESVSGAGVSASGEVEYNMTPELSMGGRVGFNSFGDYEDVSAGMFINYTFGGGSD